MTETKIVQDYHQLNAMVNMYDEQGNYQLEKDKEATRQYFLQNINQNTVFFHSLKEKLDYLIDNNFYEGEVFEKYTFDDIKKVFNYAYSFKFRFKSYLGAYKFYTSYALKNSKNDRYLERYEDRVSAVALTMADGDVEFALEIVENIITGRFQPATPTFLNAGKKARGEFVSCFLIRAEDNMESIGRTINSCLHLSKIGGGVAINLSNIREYGAPIKGVENRSSGIIPIMKILEDSFSYANQLGARQGAGAVYLNVFHPDIFQFLDTKRENADEKIRIKTLSIGVVIPDILFELARDGQDMYCFSPYDVFNETGKSLADISISEHYKKFLNNKNIKKYKINPRDILTRIAEIQIESGYPYIVFEDTVNKENNIFGRVNMSNLCTEILQTNSESRYNPDLSYDKIGDDISCNLGSLNIVQAFESGKLKDVVENAIKFLTSVSDNTYISSVSSIAERNSKTHAIGLGQMNLHAMFAKHGMEYGDEDSLEFTDLYFYCVAYYSLLASNKIAQERGEVFDGFEKSKYFSGEFFDKYLNETYDFKSEKIKKLFSEFNIILPTKNDWQRLKESVREYGIYNQYLQAVPPTGSISYINHATPSIHPVASKIEIRKEGKIGRIYYPAPYLTNENRELYKDAYQIGWKSIIDVYAKATKHVDQGLSLTLFFNEDATTRDINKAQIYAFKNGIKTLYYVRMRQEVLKGTEIQGCISCSL